MDDASEEGPLRSVAIALAVAAVLGWGLLAWSYTQSSSDETVLRGQLTRLQGERDERDGQLTKLRDANGSLTDIGAKREAAEAETRRTIAASQTATKARDTAAADLAALQGQIKAAGDEQARLKATIADLGTQRDHATADLEAARQQGDLVKQAFAKASDQLAAKNSELAELNDKVQKARGDRSAQDAAQAEANKAVAQAQGDLKALLDQRTATETAVAELTARNAQATQAKATLEQQVAALTQRSATAATDLAHIQDQVAQAKATLEQQAGAIAQRNTAAAADLARIEAQVTQAKATLDALDRQAAERQAAQPATP